MRRRDFIKYSTVLGTAAVGSSCSTLISTSTVFNGQETTINKVDNIAPIVPKDEWMKHMLLKNQFGHNPDDVDTFTAYFNFCIESGKKAAGDDYVEWFQEADTILDIFSEKVELKEDIFNFIMDCRNKLDSEIRTIFEKEDSELEALVQETRQKNTAILQNLSTTKNEIAKTSNRSNFNEYITVIEECEANLQKDYFSEEQKIEYNALVKEYSEVVSSAMSRITHNEDVQYNKNAARSFKEAYDHFKADKKGQKTVDAEFKNFYGRKLFGFDTNRLFPETQQYFNLVYASILGNLKEGEDQYQFTVMSIK